MIILFPVLSPWHLPQLTAGDRKAGEMSLQAHFGALDKVEILKAPTEIKGTNNCASTQHLKKVPCALPAVSFIMCKNIFYILITLFQHFTHFSLRASQTSGCLWPGPRSLLSPAPLIFPTWQTAIPLLKLQGGREPLLFFTFECTGFLIASSVVNQEPGPEEVIPSTAGIPDLLLPTAPRGKGSRDLV